MDFEQWYSAASAAIKGLVFGAGLIIAIGAQNAFVLRQGLARRDVFLTALVSTLGDVFLIALGIGGVGALIAGSRTLTLAATWGGGLFLLYFGWRSFNNAGRGHGLDLGLQQDKAGGPRKTVLAALGFSLLNPHVYLDTVVLIGSLGAQFPPGQRWYFGAGAMLASALWFFGLAYGASKLAPWFEKKWAAQALDLLIGVIMWGIAFSLLWEPVAALFAGNSG